MILRIGTRNSPLAIKQTELAIQQLKRHYPELEYQIIPISTTGDKIQDRNLYDIGGKALFLKELEEALIDNVIDLAVHSLKDVPGRLDPKFKISAILARENPCEVLISSNYPSITTLPYKSLVGTSSIRRKILLTALRPDLQIITLRGNVDSRVRKVLVEKQVDATLLAAAGLQRLGLFDSSYCHLISPAEILPATCQGIIAIETLKSVPLLLDEICNQINHAPTYPIMQVERSFVEYLDASCDTPLAAYARYENDKIQADFMLAKNGIIKKCTKSCEIHEAAVIGTEAAKELLAR